MNFHPTIKPIDTLVIYVRDTAKQSSFLSDLFLRYDWQVKFLANCPNFWRIKHIFLKIYPPTLSNNAMSLSEATDELEDMDLSLNILDKT